MYFNSTISDSTKLLKPVLVFAFAIAAALTGLTQITQYRSHPIDVYVGFCIGAGIAVYLVRLFLYAPTYAFKSCATASYVSAAHLSLFQDMASEMEENKALGVLHVSHFLLV